MHRAPWTKTSRAAVVWRPIAAICSSDSSRASTTRSMPSGSAPRMHSALVSVICVEACSGNSGQIARTSRAAPRSWTMTASTPAATARRTVCSNAANSRQKTSVLSVR